MRDVGFRAPLALLGACLAGGLLSACSSSTSAKTSGVTVAGSTLSIWAAKPPGNSGGPVATDVLDAERLALGQVNGRAGSYHLRLRVAHAEETSADARLAVSDKTAIAYLGEVTPGSTGVSLQITNELGLLEVSPTDTAAYLTQATKAVAGAPKHFYPAYSSFHETFARVVPTSADEASAIVHAMRKRSVKSLEVTDDGSDYGRTLALEVRGDATGAGMTVSDTASQTGGTADAAFYAGTPSGASTRAVDALTAGKTAIYLPSGLYDATWVGTLSSAAQRALTVSAPGFLTGRGNAANARFVAAFEKAYQHAPVPQAVFGYEAMSALVAVLRAAGSNAAVRSDVVADFRGLHNRASALGTYSLKGGDTSLAPFILARVVDGKLVPQTAG